MQNVLLRFLGDESGATAIEYAIMAAGVALAIVAAVGAVGSAVGDTYDLINTSMQ